jgi:hypothetical protein
VDEMDEMGDGCRPHIGGEVCKVLQKFGLRILKGFNSFGDISINLNLMRRFIRSK